MGRIFGNRYKYPPHAQVQLHPRLGRRRAQDRLEEVHDRIKKNR